MKWLFGILGIAAAGFFGYIAEPTLRPDLTGVFPEAKTPTAQAPEMSAAPAAPGGVPPAPVTTVDPPSPAPDPAPEPMDEPVQIDPEPAPEPETEPADAPPEPVVEEEPPAPAGDVDVVAVMQASIRSGEIKEFNETQVQGWQAGEEEVSDGTTYQTGLVAYTAETLFGVRTIQAKAYIKDGKVERWIWPNSGMEIK